MLTSILNKRGMPYVINAILLTIILIAIAIVRGFYPFGQNTLLTIDLGQQYIDFFNLFRDTILNDPSQFFYSFKKGIGGEMFGLWAYYLMSPFNLIFLIFSTKDFSLAVTIITYLKILAMSLSFMFFIRKIYQTQLIPSLSFSFAYALMSYTLTYLLNIMWLDGLICLPLIALGLHRLIEKQKSDLYVLSLSTMLINNFYIGFMICLFLSFYSLFVIIEKKHHLKVKSLVWRYIQFLYFSLISGLVSAGFLLPTAIFLMTSKGSGTNISITNKMVYSFESIYSKLFNSSFIYNEIKVGSPVLYAGVFVLILGCLYFMSKKIKIGEKLIGASILIIFTLSYMFEFPSKIWHGGQDPIWYPFRFSFTQTFFMLIIAIKAFQTLTVKIKLKQTMTLIVLSSAFAFYYLLRQQLFPYLNFWSIVATLTLMFLVVLLIQMDGMNKSWRDLFILVIVIVDLTSNSLNILQQFSYVYRQHFDDYTQNLISTIDEIRPQTNDFYRIHKNYARTKDEAFYANYYGLDNFSSTIETSSTNLFGYLGLPDSSATNVYSMGTLFTDDFFGIRYLLEPNKITNDKLSNEFYRLFERTSDLDLTYYPFVKQIDRIDLYENSDSFGLGMEVSKTILSDETVFKDHLPIENQELLLKLIDFNGDGQPYFKEQTLSDNGMDGVLITDKGDGNYYTYKSNIADVSQRKKGTLHYKFETNSNNPYYFTIPSQYSTSKVEITLNHAPYYFTDPFRKRQIMPAAYQQANQMHDLDVTLLTQEMQANLISLYEFNLPKYEAMMETKKDNRFNVTLHSQTKITGSITGQQEQGVLLLTIPYDQNWTAKVNGKNVPTFSVLNNTLLAIPISNGEQIIELDYFPKALIYGTIISLFGLTLWVLTLYIIKFRHKKLANK